MSKFLEGKREVFEENAYTPGPGWYSGPSDPKYNDVYKMSFFQNRSNQISSGSENNVTTFGRGDRFNYKNVDNSNPGPGHYDKARKGELQSLNNRKVMRFYKTDNKHLKSSPAIPFNGKAKMEETNLPDGLLFMIKEPTQNNNAKEGNIGPGSYEVSLHSVKPRPQNARIFEESAPKKEAPKEEKLELFLGKMEDHELRSRSAGTHFQSKDSSRQMISFIAKEKEKKTLRVKEAREKLNVENEVPPPGFYFNSKKFSSFRINPEKPKKFQYFDTAVKRFSEIPEAIPGPGEYEIDMYEKNHKKVPGQMSKDTRFKIEAKEDTPGPGEYIQEEARHERLSMCQKPGVFGSGTKRFYERKSENNVGPGSYNLAQKPSKPKKMKKFKTYIIDDEERMRLGSEPLAPDWNNKNLLYMADIEGEHERINAESAFFKELKNYNSVKGTSMFKSKVERFLISSTDANTNEIGPGTYNTKTEMIKSTFNKADSLFDKKKKVLRQQEVVDRLGPGYYDYDVSKTRPRIIHDVHLA